MILIDPYPAIGHIHSSAKLAKLLVDQGHEVIFVVPDHFEGHVHGLGFDCICVDPFVLPEEKTILRYQGWKGLLKETFRKSRKSEAIQKVNALKSLIDELNPSAVIVDVHYATKGLVYHSFGTKLVQFQTMASPTLDWNIPPIQSSLKVPDNVWDRFQVRLAWITSMFKPLAWLWTFETLLIGRSSHAIISRLVGRSAKMHRTSLGSYLSNVLVVNLAPKHFDLPRTYPASELNISLPPIIRKERIGAKLSELLEAIPDGHISVYTSLGTLTAIDLKRSMIFFNTVSEMCRIEPTIHVIASIGTYMHPSLFDPLPPNLHVFPKVPQQETLKNVDLMITHGGINSIEECIEFGVPMYVFPLTREWDQHGNASRIVYHQLGLKGDIMHTSAEEMVDVVQQLVDGRDSYTDRLAAIKEKIHESDPLEKMRLLLSPALHGR